MRFFLAIILSIIILSPVAQAAPAPIYVAPYGTAAGDGSADNPKSLAAALPAGGLIYLLPGVYKGDLTIGTAGATLQSAPGTRARIDGGVTVTGAGVTLRDLEIYDSSWTTRATATQAQQARYVNVTAQNVTIDRCVIHDLGGGVYAYNGPGGATAGLVVKNSLIYNIGWQGHGHAIYTQNDGAGSKLFQENVLANQYGFGFHAYGSSGPSAQLQNMTYQGNVQVNNRMLLGGGNALKGIAVTNNRLWRSQLQLGYGSIPNQDVTVRGNWIGQARMQVQGVMTPTVQLNRLAADNDVNVTLVPPQGVGVWDQNSYWRASNGSMANVDGVGFKSFPQWQTYTGWDATSVYAPTLPTSNWVDVQSTGPHRGIVTVYNWTGGETQVVDVSVLGLTPGASYKFVNAQNPAETLPFTATPTVSLPLTGWIVAMRYGDSTPISYDPRFAVFLVEPA